MEAFSALLVIHAGNSSVTSELWCFCLICAWIKGWVNSGEAGDLRRHRAHYDVIVMIIHDELMTESYQTNQSCLHIFFICCISWYTIYRELITWRHLFSTVQIWYATIIWAATYQYSKLIILFLNWTSHCKLISSSVKRFLIIQSDYKLKKTSYFHKTIFFSNLMRFFVFKLCWDIGLSSEWIIPIVC